MEQTYVQRFQETQEGQRIQACCQERKNGFCPNLMKRDDNICLIRVGIEALYVVAAAAGTLFNKGFLQIQWCRISFVPEKMVFFSILGFLLEWTGNE